MLQNTQRSDSVSLKGLIKNNSSLPTFIPISHTHLQVFEEIMFKTRFFKTS